MWSIILRDAIEILPHGFCTADIDMNLSTNIAIEYLSLSNTEWRQESNWNNASC